MDIEGQIHRNSDQIAKLWTQVKLALKTISNGKGSLESRVSVLEEKEAHQTCRAGELIVKHLEEHRERKETAVDAKRFEKTIRQMQLTTILTGLGIVATVVLAVVFGG